jgi:2-oxoglutarate dehydrogenase E2 component (dihydrolipoamide succinyltransferase)
MAFDIVMPQMGESIAEATILKWHRKVGEAIGKDETLYDISTDKVDAEIPSPVAGVLLEILVQENATVPVGTLVARVGSAGERQPEATQAPVATPPAVPPVAEAGAAAPVEPAAGMDEESLEGRLRTKSSPLVRRMAETHGIDLRTVKGTGLMGRVTREDMEAHLARRAAPAAAPAAAAPAPAPLAPPLPAQPADARNRIEPMSRMRKIISDNMVLSKRTSPHVYTVFEIDMTRVARLRVQHRAAFEAAYGTKLSFTPFVMAAVAKALRAFPIVNASVEGEAIVYRQDIHLGVAVSLEWGLVVPVVRNADQMNLGGLARHLNDLAERARNKQLKPDELQGGTFTITNPGVYGDVFGLPIINQPQVAILGMGGIAKRPVVVTSEDGTDAIAIRQMMFSSLGFDHRIIDGAVADQFMAVVKRELESGDFGLA